MFDIVLVKEGKKQRTAACQIRCPRKIMGLKNTTTNRFKELLSVNNHLHVKIDLNND